MPDVNPAARVYSPSLMGEATVLGSGLGPLSVALRLGQQAQVRAARVAAAKAAAEKTLTMPTLKTDGGLYFQDEVNKSVQDTTAKIGQVWVDVTAGRMTPQAGKVETARLGLESDGVSQRAIDARTDIDQVLAGAAADNLDPGKLAEAMRVSRNDAETGLPASVYKYDGATARAFRLNPDIMNQRGVLEKLVKGAALKQQFAYSTAAGPGMPGHMQEGASNYFAVNPDATFKMTKDAEGNTVHAIADLPGLEKLMIGDGQTSALLAREMERIRTANGEPLDVPLAYNTPRSRQAVANLLRPLGTVEQKNMTTNPMAVPAPRVGRAGGAAKVGDVVASETSSYELSPYKDAVTGQLINNHFNVVGHSFGSQKQPFAVVKVNTRDMTSLGAGKVLSTAVGDKTNSSSTMNVAGRGFVLEIGGKRSGRAVVPDGMNSYQDLAEAIRSLTPAQRRRAVLKMYYVGSVADKAKVGGDGAGEGARVIGYKDPESPGSLLSAIDLDSAIKRGEKPVPVYDQEDTQSKKLVPASQETDAQLKAQSPGYDPRVLTREQAELVRLLDVQGESGGYVTPYHAPRSRGGYNDVAPKPTAKPAGGTSGYYTRKPPVAAKKTDTPPSTKSANGGAY